MKSMMRKTTLREIRQSLGRYIAILSIVALGVGFFAGLKVTKAVMVVSADDYLREAQFFDYRLLSTLGFEKEDVDALAAKDAVRAAEGAVYADIVVVSEQENEIVLRAHSLTKLVNGVELTAGRMPEAADECVVDSLRYTEEAIGSKIRLSENNEEEDLENFTYREYTVVGVVQASSYIQFERGNTSLGNGMIDGFFYLPIDGFAMDYYMEIYIKFDRDYQIYSDEYQDYMDEMEPLWEQYVKEQGMRRYDAIIAEAMEELAAAEAELDEERSKAKQELADAWEELTTAREELDDAYLQLSEAKDELKHAENTIGEKQKELDDGDAALLAAEEQLIYLQMAGIYPLEILLGMQEELAAQRALLEAGKAELTAAKDALTDAEREILENEQKIADGEAELLDGWAEYEEAFADAEKQIAEAEEKLADARADIEAIEEPETYVLGRGTNIGYVCFESDSSIVEGISNVFPVFFFLVAALVCMTTMNRMVEEQRTQIGVLKALGYGNGTIMGKYLFYSGSAAFTGCILGYFAGTHLFPWVIYTVYGIMYKLGAIHFVVDLPLFCISLVCALACSMGTTWLSLRYELREVAAGLMRPKAPKAGKRVFLEHVPFIWKRLKFLQKVSVRNIVRYKKRFFMMVMGISGCTALLVTGLGIRDSITDIADQQFGEIMVYQISLTLQEGVTKEGGASLSELDALMDTYGGAYLASLETTMDLIVGDRTKAINLIVAKDPDILQDYIHLQTVTGEILAYPGVGEAVITDKLAQTYGLDIGDTIELRDEDQRKIQAVVSGICENYIYNYVYLHPETYAAAMGEAVYKNLYINLSENTDVHTAGAALMRLDNVTAVSVNEDILVRFSSMMGSMNYIVLVVIGSAGALAFIVLYNLNNINITERIREIATIKVLGFFKRETASYVFRENRALTAIGCAVGLILGKLLHMYVMHEINIDMVSFHVQVTVFSYVLSVVLTFFFNWIVNRMMVGKLEKINMAESLKSVD